MAATTKGTAHLYGVEGTYSNATVESFDKKTSCKIMATTEDEDGTEIERRYDDVHNDATMVIRLRTGASIPTPGSTVTYNSETFEVVDTSKATKNKDFRRLTLTLKNSEGITYS